MLQIGDKTNFGIIQEVYKSQYRINDEWTNEKIVYPVSEIVTLHNHTSINYITLYHGTDVESYNTIMSTKTFGDGEHIYFFTSNKQEAKNYADMKAKYRGKSTGKVITFKIPNDKVQYNNGSGEYETEYQFKFNGNEWIVV